MTLGAGLASYDGIRAKQLILIVISTLNTRVKVVSSSRLCVIHQFFDCSAERRDPWFYQTTYRSVPGPPDPRTPGIMGGQSPRKYTKPGRFGTLQ